MEAAQTERGVGYRMESWFAMPIFQREGRGKVLYAEADQQQWRWETAVHRTTGSALTWTTGFPSQVRARDR